MSRRLEGQKRRSAESLIKGNGVYDGGEKMAKGRLRFLVEGSNLLEEDLEERDVPDPEKLLAEINVWATMKKGSAKRSWKEVH